MAIKQPKDKSHFILPDLGEGVHEAELIRWRVKPGETVEEHQTLAEMETDKALVEVPSPWAGVIRELHGKEGEVLNVGSTLVSYEAGRAPASSAPASRDASSAPAAEVKADTESNGRDKDAGTVVGTVDATLTVPAKFTRPAAAAAQVAPPTKALATPAVRRVAQELRVDINLVPGTGRGGRVTASDVHAFHERIATTTPKTRRAGAPAGRPARPAASADAAPLPALSADGIAQRIPFRGVRRKIAESLDRSVKTAVHFTVVDEADITELEQKRREYSAVIGRKLSYLPFVMTAVCHALRDHPRVNAHVDDANQEILIKGVINLGCAVDTEHGLMVPVIDSADRLSLVQLADAVADVAIACRNRSIERERLIGGTFTISNVGSFGGLFATPIINYPEVAILAVGRAIEKVLTRDGMFFAGRVLPLSLSCDHRVVDGAEGARFLNTVRLLLESPSRLLPGA